MRPTASLLMLSLPLLTAATCSVAPTAPEASDDEVVTTIALTTPVANGLIPQNVTGLGCDPHDTRGYGFRIRFEWGTNGPEADGAEYHLFAKRSGARYPIVDELVTETTFTETSCNTFVADPNLEDWEWKVRTIAPDGTPGPWSEVRPFHFEPCRLEDGRPCHALPPG